MHVVNVTRLICFKEDLYLFLCVSVHVHMCTGAQGGRKRMLGVPQLELHVAVSSLMWELGAKLWSCANALHSEPSLQPWNIPVNQNQGNLKNQNTSHISTSCKHKLMTYDQV